ncbi:DUF960 domain-containing protein [Agrilactobacillus yilanensis]|uniref:DUF960 domain-containing protein n=1 Tax=Agrilactobacillus yilanensis TaxID=2485997 RepID=A0ABW4J966_9LACO|nr:DUF960 domain-containing protein [Agrilactobacillus yilanensis]
MFKTGYGRYATFGVVEVLPGDIIDRIWHIIDQNLQGVVPLQSILKFQLTQNKNKLTVTFSEDNIDLKMAFDLPYEWQTRYPKTVLAYDDGVSQTILLPSESHR